MAIIKNIPTDFGVDAAYWNIGAVQEDFKGRGTEVTLYGYLSEDARREDRNPLSAAKIVFSGEKYVADAKRCDLYELIKQDPAFAGASDV